ncbi:ly6/PLAUR domain-containing protein 3 [Harpia harpyja]|uniref:ly6/PLAUR domain-containing protein 3 n=1 Tax=Harpia harpyja TaxID=202280 RepID=UPI0022B0DC08|nr:ly6/PLAUR domain-containing protein 3 [Harpia harpyja]
MCLGWGWALLAALLVPAPALRCGGVPCPSPQDACRRTTLTTLTGGDAAGGALPGGRGGRLPRPHPPAPLTPRRAPPAVPDLRRGRRLVPAPAGGAALPPAPPTTALTSSPACPGKWGRGGSGGVAAPARAGGSWRWRAGGAGRWRCGAASATSASPRRSRPPRACAAGPARGRSPTAATPKCCPAGGGLTHCALARTYGAVGLECLSCGAEDGTCRGATNVTCPPESDVCAEALAAVTWSHGRFSLGGRGCGRGQAGANARALELFGLVVFVRRHQCQEGGGCNGELPLGLEGALPLPGNESGRVPNGVLCYGCPDDGPCPPTTVVQCYDDLRGCFHGNVTLNLGGVTLWREVRGCVRDQSCTQESPGGRRRGAEGFLLRRQPLQPPPGQ